MLKKMNLFGKKKKYDEQDAKQNTKEEVEHIEENDQEEMDLSNENTASITPQNEELEELMLEKESFLRGLAQNYDLHMYFPLSSETAYAEIKEAMYREHLKDTDLSFNLFKLKEPEIEGFVNGSHFLQFSMTYEQINHVPFELDEEFKTVLLAMLYTEIFEGQPLVAQQIIEATVYSGDDMMPNEKTGEDEKVLLAPTLSIIFKPDTSEDLVLEAVAHLYDQLAVYGYVVRHENSVEIPNASDDTQLDEFEEDMKKLMATDENIDVPQFDQNGHRVNTQNKDNETTQKLNPNHDTELNQHSTKMD